jgi:5-oxoprolinase (ATP-hydrolysing)
VQTLKQAAIEKPLSDELLHELGTTFHSLDQRARSNVEAQGFASDAIRVARTVALKYDGTDSTIELLLDRKATSESLRKMFEATYKQRYGFLMPGRGLVIEAIASEAIGLAPPAVDGDIELSERLIGLKSRAEVKCFSDDAMRPTSVFYREDLRPGDRIEGPAIIKESNATTIVAPEWFALVMPQNHLVLERAIKSRRADAIGTSADPILLEVFNNLFMAIAEQMGVTLANTSYSVNIKERLDFSCAIFDPDGNLVANAPHMPVHLGSMGESVRVILEKRAATMKAGDAFVLNAPYAGGTHIPDVTVVMPVFLAGEDQPLFYTAARGHHADIGGITPGSMPPFSTHIREEGVLLDNVQIVRDGVFLEEELTHILTHDAYPVRNVTQNIADLRAQIASCNKGANELAAMVEHFGREVVVAYMQHVQDNAEESVRRVIHKLSDGEFGVDLDDGSHIQVKVSIDLNNRSAKVDFTGTSAQRLSNFNAPRSVSRAVVLYVFRTLVDDDIPMNAGCLKPIEIIIPDGSMLSPVYPAAVVAGNVEVSQAATNCLYGALGALAGAYGTMTNFTFGNDQYQYYETISGGSGAGPTFDGTSVVQCHMTNSRLTDPEVLEFRYPVRVESHSINRGTGGAGRFRGGDGADRRIRFLAPMTAAILANNRVNRPHGMAGGGQGAAAKNWVERHDGARENYGHICEVQMDAGDVFVIQTPGGGGFGSSDQEPST